MKKTVVPNYLAENIERPMPVPVGQFSYDHFYWPAFKRINEKMTAEEAHAITAVRRFFVFSEMCAPFPVKVSDKDFGSPEHTLVEAYAEFIAEVRDFKEVYDDWRVLSKNFNDTSMFVANSKTLRVMWENFKLDAVVCFDKMRQQKIVSVNKCEGFFRQIEDFLFQGGLADKSINSGVIGRIDDLFHEYQHADHITEDSLIGGTRLQRMLGGKETALHEKHCDREPTHRLFVIKRNMQIAEVQSLRVQKNHEGEFYIEFVTYMNKSCQYGADFLLSNIKPQNSYSDGLNESCFLTPIDKMDAIKSNLIINESLKGQRRFQNATTTMVRGMNGRKLYTKNKATLNLDSFDDGRTMQDVVGLMFCSEDAVMFPLKDEFKARLNFWPQKHCLEMIRDVRRLGEYLNPDVIMELTGVEVGFKKRLAEKNARKRQEREALGQQLKTYQMQGGLLL